MKHAQLAGGVSAMDVDHFDPRRKKDYLQSYANLFLATRSCNGKKSDFWPEPELQAKGIRFLNCCEEQDYGVHVFEDPVTHEVFGVTPAGKYHVRILDLNTDDLVTERKVRADLRIALTETFATMRGSLDQISRLVGLLRGQLELMIPDIEFRRRVT